MTSKFYIEKLESILSGFEEDYSKMKDEEKKEFTRQVIEFSIIREKEYLKAEELAESILKETKKRRKEDQHWTH